jgi:hypothetical protein
MLLQEREGGKEGGKEGQGLETDMTDTQKNREIWIAGYQDREREKRERERERERENSKN